MRDVENLTLSRQSAQKGELYYPHAPSTQCSPETFSYICVWYSFLLQVRYSPGPSAAERIRQTER
jgi:hypothetical protein